MMKGGKKSLNDHDNIQHSEDVNGICNLISIFNIIFREGK